MKLLHNMITLAALAAITPTAMAAGDLTADSVAARLERQRYEYPQETIHVTTDQGVYLAGDTIWMRPFVVDASTHRQVGASRYVYVELAAPTGDVVKRVKLLGKNGRYKGYLPLPMTLPEGRYTLSAYTTFMRNQGQDFFFRKPLNILSPYALREGFEVKGVTDGKLAIERRTDEGTVKVEAAKQERTMKKKGRSLNIGLSKSEKKAGTILVSNGNYSRYVTLAPADTALSVTMHPEGGYLVPDVECRVGVKAIGADGLSRELAGQVVDSRGNAVATVSTLHAGMGTFTLTPRTGESYTLVANGVRYPLPAADARAAALHVDGADTPDAPVTVHAVGRVPAGSMLLVQSRGVFKSLNPIAPNAPVTIARADLIPGITQLLLIDPTSNTLSERLVWNAPK